MKALALLALAPVLALAASDPAGEPAGIALAPPVNGADSGQPLARDQFLGAVADELARHFNLEGDLRLELLRPVPTPDRLAREWRVQVVEFPSIAGSSMLVRCRVLADQVPVLDTNLVLRACLWREVWVARQPALIGAVVDPAQCDTRRVDLFRERDALPAIATDGFIFTRNVQPGHVLSWRDIARRPLVKKGDVVEVSASDGLLSISMKALAMQNGAKGEAVTVRNLESRKDFTAFVVDENRVQVRF